VSGGGSGGRSGGSIVLSTFQPSALDSLAKPVLPLVNKGDKIIVEGKAATVTGTFVRSSVGVYSISYEIDKPPAPVVKVGDVINGDTLRAVRWKRGTVIAIPFGSSYALRSDGKWQYLNGSTSHAFSEFTGGKYRVDYAPGK